MLIDRAQPNTYVARCALPKSARGWLTFCVVAQDAAGLRSQPSCGRVTFARLNATAPYRYDRVGGGNVRLTRFRPIRAGGRA